MWEDPIVAEVRKIREEYAAQFSFDLQSLCRAWQEQEQRDPRPKVSYPPKPAKIVPRREVGASWHTLSSDRTVLLRETATWEAASDEDALKVEKLLSENR